MSEIKNPDQHLDNPSIGSSPEELRAKQTTDERLGNEIEASKLDDLKKMPGCLSDGSSKESSPKETDEKRLGDDLKTMDVPHSGDAGDGGGPTKEERGEVGSQTDTSELKRVDTTGLVVLEDKSPQLANEEWRQRGYEQPPYSSSGEVKGVAQQDQEFVRVFSYNEDGSSNKMGSWIMKKDDVSGLSGAEIKDKYALPREPTHICDVKVPEGFELQTGFASPVDGWGEGGGQQFDTLGKRLPPSAFINERPLESEDN